MLHTSTPQSLQNTTEAVAKERRRTILVISLVIIETMLVMLALVPPQLWTRLLPNSTSAAFNGPFPPVIAPFITILLYLLPTIIGFLCFSWQQALLDATLPAWIGLGVFLVAASFKVGPFYLLSPDHVTANLSLLELFAALGALGWLGRHLIKLK